MTSLVQAMTNLPVPAAALLKITALLALAWLLHFAFARRNPRWRVLLWRLVMVGLIFLPPAELLQPKLRVQVEPPPAPAESVSIAAPDALDRLTIPEPDVSGGRPSLPVAAPAAPKVTIWTAAAAHWPLILGVIWAVTVLMIAVRRAFIYMRLRRLVDYAAPAPNFICALAKTIAGAVGCRPPDLRLTANLLSPFVTGIMRPVVVIPAVLAEDARKDDLPAILAHELAHIRSRDLFWMALGRWISTLLWFHPLAWKLRGAHGGACEEVCDGIAAEHTGGAPAYSRSLASTFLELVVDAPQPVGVPMIRPSEIMQRIRRLRSGICVGALARKWVAVALVAGLMFLTVLGSMKLVSAIGPNPKHYTIKDGMARFTIEATDEDLIVLDNHPEITFISIAGSGVYDGPDPRTRPLPITDAGFAHLANCRKLQNLELGIMQPLRVTDDGLKYLSGLKELRRIVLGATPFTDAGIAHLAPLSNMEELWLDFNEVVGDGSMVAIREMKKLRVLRFHGAKVTDAGLAMIQDLTGLEDLQLGKATVTNAGLTTIGRFSKLKTLDLQHTRITDEGMPQLKKLRNLQWLCLQGTNVSSNGLANIAGLTNLEWLILDQTQVDDAGLSYVGNMVRLQSLYVSNTNVTDAGLAHIGGLKQLKYLKLNGLPITDEGIKALDPLSALQSIEINETKVSDKGIEWLRRVHPKLEFPNRPAGKPAAKPALPADGTRTSATTDTKADNPLGASEPKPDGKISRVQGHVYRYDKPLANALVMIREDIGNRRGSLRAPNVRTNPNGEYSYDQIAWPYTVVAQCSETLATGSFRYMLRRTNAVYNGNQTIDFRFGDFPKGNSTLIGHVTESDGKPIGNFRVCLNSKFDEEDVSSNAITSTFYEMNISSTDGRFSISGLPWADYDVFIDVNESPKVHDDFRRNTYRVVGEKTEVTIPIAKKPAFWGRIEGAQHPDPDTQYSILFHEGTDPGYAGIANADDDGYFALYLTPERIEGLKSGSSELKLSRESRSKKTGMTLMTIPFEQLGPSRDKAGVFEIKPPAENKTEQQSRTIEFPADGHGLLDITPADGAAKKYMAAKGSVQVAPGEEVHLLVNSSTLAELKSLKPGDLQSLTISWGPAKSDPIDSIAHLTALKKLEIRLLGKSYYSSPNGDEKPPISAEDLGKLKGLTNLQELELYMGLTDVDLAVMREFPSIRSLAFGVTGMTGTGLSVLKEMPNLESVALMGPSSPPHAIFNEANLSVLKECPHLKKFYFGADFAVSEEGFEMLGKCPAIETLGLNVTAMSERSLALLKNYPNLRELGINYVRSTMVTGERLDLTQMPKLEKIRVSLPNPSDKLFDELANFKGTVRLYLPRFPNARMSNPGRVRNLVELGLTYTVNDEGLVHLRNLKKLQSLDLNAARISDVSVPILASMNSLSRLHLIQTDVTSEGLVRLQTALPECQIVYVPRTDDRAGAAPARHAGKQTEDRSRDD